MKIVVIGGCAAGPKVAAKCKRMNPENEVVLYTKENLVSYSACGLPYYIGGSVDDINKLIVRTPEEFREQGVEVFVNHECTKILPDEKAIIVNNEKVHYDELVIATGAKSAPLRVENVDLENIFHLRNLPDGEKIKKKMQQSQRVLIIGGGYIGMELLEAFVKNKVHTTIVEITEQIMPLFDRDMAVRIHDYIQERDGELVDFILGDCVEKFLGENGQFKGIKTASGKEIFADFCVIATGVIPNVDLARDCGLKIGKTGAIKVDNTMRTSIPHIWAAGDCTEKHCLITKRAIYISLGSIANKEGRVCAININGGNETFEGILFSAVTRYFGYTMSTTGLSEKVAFSYSTQINITPVTATITKADKAGYMPEMQEITLKLIADKRSGDILGAQAVGLGDADKRINIVTSAIQSGLSVNDLLQLDLTYAPPFGVAVDPLHEAAYALKKQMKK